MPKILAVAGSYRENSYNKRVLAIAADGGEMTDEKTKGLLEQLGATLANVLKT